MLLLAFGTEREIEYAIIISLTVLNCKANNSILYFSLSLTSNYILQ